MIASARTTLQQWYDSNKSLRYLGKIELRLADPEGTLDKASLLIEHNNFLATFTAWGTGTTEWIVVDASTTDTVINRDDKFHTAEELVRIINEAIKDIEK
jgi:hypothetical protein